LQLQLQSQSQSQSHAQGHRQRRLAVSAASSSGQYCDEFPTSRVAPIGQGSFLPGERATTFRNQLDGGATSGAGSGARGKRSLALACKRKADWKWRCMEPKSTSSVDLFTQQRQTDAHQELGPTWETSAREEPERRQQAPSSRRNFLVDGGLGWLQVAARKGDRFLASQLTISSLDWSGGQQRRNRRAIEFHRQQMDNPNLIQRRHRLANGSGPRRQPAGATLDTPRRANGHWAAHLDCADTLGSGAWSSGRLGHEASWSSGDVDGERAGSSLPFGRPPSGATSWLEGAGRGALERGADNRQRACLAADSPQLSAARSALLFSDQSRPKQSTGRPNEQQHFQQQQQQQQQEQAQHLHSPSSSQCGLSTATPAHGQPTGKLELQAQVQHTRRRDAIDAGSGAQISGPSGAAEGALEPAKRPKHQQATAAAGALWAAQTDELELQAGAEWQLTATDGRRALMEVARNSAACLTAVPMETGQQER